MKRTLIAFSLMWAQFVPVMFAQHDRPDWVAAILDEMAYTLEFAFGEIPAVEGIPGSFTVTQEFLDGAHRASVRVTDSSEGVVCCEPGFEGIYRLRTDDDGNVQLDLSITVTEDVEISGVQGTPAYASVSNVNTKVSLPVPEWTVIGALFSPASSGSCIAVRVIEEANNSVQETPAKAVDPDLSTLDEIEQRVSCLKSISSGNSHGDSLSCLRVLGDS